MLKTSTERAIRSVWGDDPVIREDLLAEERERQRRDKGIVRFCPICGKRPEDGVDKSGRHIFNLHCEKCQLGCVIHVNK
jgi:hypothetical protein